MNPSEVSHSSLKKYFPKKKVLFQTSLFRGCGKIIFPKIIPFEASLLPRLPEGCSLMENKETGRLLWGILWKSTDWSRFWTPLVASCMMPAQERWLTEPSSWAPMRRNFEYSQWCCWVEYSTGMCIFWRCVSTGSQSYQTVRSKMCPLIRSFQEVLCPSPSKHKVLIRPYRGIKGALRFMI